MLKLASAVVLVFLASAGLAVEKDPPLRTMNPQFVRYSGKWVKQRNALAYRNFTFSGETYWLTNTGLHRQLQGGGYTSYDFHDLTANSMKQDTGTSKGGYVSKSGWNCISHGSTLWLASNGFGIFEFDPKNEFWTRHDNTPNYVGGKHMWVLHVDESYVFAGAGWGYKVPVLNVFSQKQRRWINLDRVPADFVISLGNTPHNPNASMPSRDYRSDLKDGFFVFPASVGADYSVRKQGGDYIWAVANTSPKTEVRIPTVYLEKLFATKDEAGLTQEDIAVFEAALFVPGSARKGTYIVQRETELRNLPDAQFVTNDVLSDFKDEPPTEAELEALTQSLRDRNVYSASIPLFGPKGRIDLRSKTSIDAMLMTGDWKSLRESVAVFDGLETLSMPGYSKDGNTALILRSHHVDGKAGTGNLECYRKKNGKWTMWWSVMIWRS